MAIFFSKSNGFFDDGIHSNIPADAVAITKDQHTALLNAQSKGHSIQADAKGNPIAVAPGLSQVQAMQVQVLSSACRTHLTGGFTSSALGTEHTYGSQTSDQQNLTDALCSALAGNLGESISIPLWCASGSTWAFTPHTVAQVQQLHSDWVAFRLAAQQKLLSLKAEVAACTSTEAIASVSW